MWTDNTGDHEIPVHREAYLGSEAEAGTVGIGDRIRRANGESATVGIVMDHHQFGPVLTTAGHLFLDGFTDGERVFLTTGGVTYPGRVVSRRLATSLDYALIQLDEPLQHRNWYLPQYRLRQLFAPSQVDRGTALFILTADRLPRNVTCKAVGARGMIDGRPMEDLILTEWRTRPGDSGACLVDAQQRAWGLLVGRIDTATFSLSAFAPAHLAVFEETSTFITREE
ncbi:MAG TPA: hypothetical protein VF824_10675 [Thermoanaerobaculia bacterium]|jgi:hypothetical protein